MFYKVMLDISILVCVILIMMGVVSLYHKFDKWMDKWLGGGMYE